MSRFVFLAIFLAAGSFVTAGADDDILREQKQLNAILAEKLKAEYDAALLDAYKDSTKNPAHSADILKLFRPQVEDDKSLSVDRRTEMLKTLDKLIRSYDDRAKTVRIVIDEERKQAILRERRESAQRESERSADVSATMSLISQLRRQGKFAEASSKARELSDKYGVSPTSLAAANTNSIQDQLNTIKSLQNEKDRRYVAAMNEVVKSSMPIIGDIEFPADWKKKTEKRLKPQYTEKEAKLIKALNTPVTQKISGQPLNQVLDALEKNMGVTITLDRAALEGALISYEFPITAEANGITFRSYLRKILSNANLTFVIRDEGIFVTTPERASRMLVTKVYYVGDLLPLLNFMTDPYTNQLQFAQTVAGLIAEVQSIDPTSWQSGGGNGVIYFQPATMSIIVKQTAEMQWVLQGKLGR